MIAALLVAGAAIAHAVWNIAMKRAGTSGTTFITATLVIGVVALAPVGVPALVVAPPASAAFVPLVLGSAALQLAYFLLLQRGYRLADVGVVYPLARGAGPLLSVVGAVLLLGERPGAVALAGAALVVAGVVIVGLAGARAGADAGGEVVHADAAARRWRGIRYGAAVGVVIAAYTLWDAAAVTRADLEPVGYYWASMVVQLAVLLPLALRERGALARTVREHPVAVSLVGVLSPLAYVAVLAAYTLAPVSLVAPAREVSVVLIALAGWLLLREPHPARRLLGSAVVLAGIALLAFG
ncbi:EamA family transporter [Microcella sp.]|uniref:EamA family transporter n=1 Tax=Microcella sp. TaxID=1913979 RepID=UPI00391D117C